MKKTFIILFCSFFICIKPAFATDVTFKYMNMDWWNAFNDKYLTANLLKLYENNYDLKNTALKIKESEQTVKMQFAQELPEISILSEFSRDFKAPRQQFGAMEIPNYSQYNYHLPLTVGYELDIWGKNRFKTKSKQQQLEIIKQAQRATYISLTSDFVANYFNLIKADKLIEIQNELIKTQEKVLSMVADKYKIGLCSVNELLSQENFLTLLKEERNRHKQNKELLINNLRVYLSDSSDNIKRNNYNNIVLIKNIPTEYSTDIITNRPDYLQEEANLRSIGFDVKVAKREFLPTFTIFGQIGLNAYHLSSLFNSPAQFFNAGIFPLVDLFSGGRKVAILKIQKYRYESALNDYQKVFLTGVKEMNTGLVDYKTAISNYNESIKRLKVESKIYNLAKDKNSIGGSSNLDVLIAKEVYLMTEKENVSNKINSLISVVSLYKASGGVDLHKINERI